jgi:hypothetical protein
MGKYKNRAANTVAEMALKNLISKIPTMIADYTAAMNRFAKDEEAQDRYIKGVTMWTNVMRNDEVRLEIANAVQRAKSRYRNMAVAGYATIPATIRR